MKNLIIIGAGGFGREVFDLANYCYGNDPQFRIKGFLSDAPSNIESMGYPPVLATVDDYNIAEGDVFTHAIGNVIDREKCVKKILSKGGRFVNLIHPNTIISPSVQLGTGVAIKAFCVLASNAMIGSYTFLQSSVILGHDVIVGSFCQINSFSFFAGCVKVEDSVTVNAGAKIVQGKRIGKGATIGIGSVIIKNVPDGKKLFGNPAKIFDEL